MSIVLDMYKQKFEEAGGSREDIKNYKLQALKRKIEKKFENVAFERVGGKVGNIIFSKDVDPTDALKKASMQQDEFHEITTVVALKLRECIKSAVGGIFVTRVCTFDISFA